jgi:CRP-like cAMP-binding protein
MLLSSLSPEAMSFLHTHLREKNFGGGQVLWNAGGRLSEVYFPLSGMISIRVPTKNGHAAEVAVIGREAAAGLHDRLGILPVFTQARVEASGLFVSIPARAIAAAVRESEELGRLVLACKDWLLLQSQQLAACNAVHGAYPRLCRWLLRAADALGLETVPAKQDTIAGALGIRRTTATIIAQQLQMQNVIKYSRGKIAIRNRDRLEAAACDCYRVLGKGQWPAELLRQDRNTAPLRGRVTDIAGPQRDKSI